MQKKTLTKALAVVGLAGAMALTPIAANAYAPTPTDEVGATIGSPAAPSTGDGTGGDDLAATGLDNSALGLWVGGGALLLGGGAVLVSRSVRKQKSQA